MIKAAATLDDGSLLVVLGLSDGNEAALRNNRPIVFNLSDLGGPDRKVCVTYKHLNGGAAFPKGFCGVSLVFSRRAMKAMHKAPQDAEYDGVKFVIFRGKDEATMEQEFSGLVDARTKVTRTGYAPSDLPPGQN